MRALPGVQAHCAWCVFIIVWGVLHSERFTAPLARFRNKVAYSNLELDDKVPHDSAAIMPTRACLTDAATQARYRLHIVQVPIPAADAAAYKHIHSVYQQHVFPGTSAPAAAASTDVDGKPVALPTSPATVTEIPSVASSVAASAYASPGFDADGGVREVMCMRLRTHAGLWRNVEVDFGDDGTGLQLNHFRIAGNRDGLGIPGIRYIVQRCFVV